MPASLENILVLFSTCLWTGIRVAVIHHSVIVYLTAHNGRVKGCEDVRPVQLIAATLKQILCFGFILCLFTHTTKYTQTHTQHAIVEKQQ